MNPYTPQTQRNAVAAARRSPNNVRKALAVAPPVRCRNADKALYADCCDEYVGEDRIGFTVCGGCAEFKSGGEW